MCYECLDLLAKILFMHQKLFFQACFHNYFVSVPRWNVIYSSAIKLFFFSFFPLPVPGGIKKKTTTQSHSLKKETTCSPLSFIGRCLLVCDITSVPHFFSLRNRPSIRNCEEKIYNSRKYIFQPKFYFFYFFFFIIIAYLKKKFLWNQVLACTPNLGL